MNNLFFDLHPTLQQILAHRYGWDSLREVQEGAVRAVSGGFDTLVIAPTAGGKTEAALIPVIDDILKRGAEGVAVVYISPLKALINDQEERFTRLCTPAGISVQKWHGDVPRGRRSWEPGCAPEVLMITPESLGVLLLEGDLRPDLSSVRFVIIDEIHAVVESLRGVQLRAVMDRLEVLAPPGPLRIGLSATVGNPGAVLSWFRSGSRESMIVSVPVPTREKHFSFSLASGKDGIAADVARVVRGRKAIVFVQSRGEAEELASRLSGRIDHCAVHHSSLAAPLRRAVEERFRGGGSACVISTSTLELGIDIGDLDLVVQAGPPPTVSSFLQRMGRTGRRGVPPHVACLVTDPCALLFMVAAIESASRREVEDLVPPSCPLTVLVQQILVRLREGGRVPCTRLIHELSALGPFSGLPTGVVPSLVAHMEEAGFLVRDGDLLMAGPEAERQYGRANWKEIYTVIAGGDEVRAVMPDGTDVGTLDTRFARINRPGSFSLGGRRWEVQQGGGRPGEVVLVPSGAPGRKVFWSGSRGGFSPLVCQAVLRIAARGESSLPLPEGAVVTLQDALARLPAGLKGGTIHVRAEGEGGSSGVRVFSFGGASLNRVVALSLPSLLEKKGRVRYGDISVFFRGFRGDSGVERIVDALSDLAALEEEDLLPLLPEPRDAGKFAVVLPAGMRQRMVFADYYRGPEALRVLRDSPVRVLPPAGPSPLP